MEVPRTWGESRKCYLFLAFMIYSFLKLDSDYYQDPSQFSCCKTAQLSSCSSFWHLFVYVNYLHGFHWVFPGPWKSLFRDTYLVSSLSAVSHVSGLGGHDCPSSLPFLLKSHRAGCLQVCCGTGLGRHPGLMFAPTL